MIDKEIKVNYYDGSTINYLGVLRVNISLNLKLIEILNLALDKFAEQIKEKSPDNFKFTIKHFLDITQFIKIDGKSYIIENSNCLIKDILLLKGYKCHLELLITIEFGSLYGRIEKPKIDFFFHSNENTAEKHPHIHVKYDNLESVYNIRTLKKITGVFYKSKIEKKIYYYLKDNQENILEEWDLKTIGLKIIDLKCYD